MPRAPPPSGQRLFLLGRITAETTSLDAALRFVHAALRGRHERHDGIDDGGRRAIHSTLTAANKLYATRNRYIHDLLRADLLSGGWELAGLERQSDGEQNITATTFDGMVQLVEDLVGVTWRLRGAAFYILNGSWIGLSTGAVEGQWDGSADYVS